MESSSIQADKKLDYFQNVMKLHYLVHVIELIQQCAGQEQ